MPGERVEVLRRVYDDWARGDFRPVAELFDPHVVLVLRQEFPDAGAYHGPEEIATYTRRDLLGSWADFRIEAEDFFEAGDSVVVQIHQRGVGLSSGLATDLRYFMVWTFRGNAIIRIESILDREQALEAVGLREREDPAGAGPS
jgi:ketosteroid isomerase-like protein